MTSSKDREVADSTDWLATPIPKLAAVDSALRCQVCKDFYDTPMITSCSHTFCSLCIRRCLSNDGKCPACRANDQESKLRQNWAVGELVEAFNAARQEVLDFAKRPVEISMEEGPGKRKRGDLDRMRHESPSKRIRESGRTTRSTRSQVVEIQDSDEDYEPEQEQVNNEDGLVECPICSGRMTVEAVQIHIDKCNGIPPSKKPPIPHQLPITDSSTAISKPLTKPEYLAKPHYASMKDIALKKKLAEYGLSAYGNRQMLEKRWSEYVITYNANCDSKNPKTKSELRNHMDVWERTQGNPKVDREGALIKDKNFDGTAWSMTHAPDFKDLIAQARRNRAAKKDKEIEERREVQSKDDTPAPNLLLPRPSNAYATPYPSTSSHSIVPPTNPHQLPDQISAGGNSFPQFAEDLSSESRSQPIFYQEPDLPPPFDEYGHPPSSQLRHTPTRSQDPGPAI
ncbi:hypothetical protein B0O99DRAFT_595420 [Bisporella sp. PMI_857]|nr:hypothetical protein B0O99DRAFT_595420 [Bisporella sp. PMI_857]